MRRHDTVNQSFRDLSRRESVATMNPVDLLRAAASLQAAAMVATAARENVAIARRALDDMRTVSEAADKAVYEARILLVNIAADGKWLFS
jgi:hypothetical protein